MDTPTPERRVPDDRYLAVVSLDIERFSRNTDADGTRIATDFRNAVERAFERTGLTGAFAGHEFMQNSGDGLVAGFDGRHLPNLVDRIPSALQVELRELHHQNRLGVRMRMGISFGPVHGIADKRVDVAPNRTVIDACRIADAAPTRLLLRRSDPEATFLAVALTAPVMDFTVNRNPLWLKQSEFVEVDIAMPEKGYGIGAYLHVPSPSGELLRTGLLGPDDAAAPEAADPEGSTALEERVEPAARAGHSLTGTFQGDRGTQIGQAHDVHSEQISTGPASGPNATGAVTGGTVNNRTDIGRDGIFVNGNGSVDVTNIDGEQVEHGNGRHRAPRERDGRR